MRVGTLLIACSLSLLASVAVAQAPAPQGGFRLNESEQRYLDQVLAQWEQRSAEISTFSCDFTRLEYDPVFGPGINPETGQQRHKTEGAGAVSYQRPDKGSFQVKKLLVWDAKQQSYVENPNLIGEHWVCDGKSVFEYRHDQEQLVERPIPPEMQGKNIADGPLPFLFGAEAAKLKARFWLRPDPRAAAGTIWLHAEPKTRADAANYRAVDIMLDSKKMLPVAMRVTSPANSETTYTFDLAGASINSRMSALWNTLFQAPKTPWGWKRVVLEPEVAAAVNGTRR